MQVEAILPLLKTAGEEVLKIYNSSFEVIWKKENDPLTQADLVVNQILSQGLAQITPGIPLLSEEIEDNSSRLNSSRIWILDPIDGTREFVKKNPEFAISLGFVEDGKSKYGFILNPASKELIYGGQGDGVYYIKDFHANVFPEKKSLLNFSNLEKPVLLLSPTEVKDGLFENPFWEKNFSIKVIGSIAYKLGLLACGFGDLIISARPKSEWDVCGGVALVLASGQVCFTLAEFEEYQFNQPNIEQKGLIAGKKEIIYQLIQSQSGLLKNTFRAR